MTVSIARIYRVFSLAFLVSLAGCASAPPIETIVNAEITIRKANSLGAAEHAPKELEAAIKKLELAKQSLTKGDYEVAHRLAEQAQVQGNLTEAITTAALAEEEGTSISETNMPSLPEAEVLSQVEVAEGDGAGLLEAEVDGRVDADAEHEEAWAGGQLTNTIHRVPDPEALSQVDIVEGDSTQSNAPRTQVFSDLAPQVAQAETNAVQFPDDDSRFHPDEDGLPQGEVAEKNAPGMPETEPDVLVDAGARFQETLAEEETIQTPEITTHKVPEAFSQVDLAEGATMPSLESNTPVRPDSLSQPALAEADAIPSSEVGSMILPDADGLSRGGVAEKNTPGMPETEPDVLVDAGAEFQEALAEEEATPIPEITTHRVPEAVSPLDVAEGATTPSMEPNTPVRPDSLSQPALAEADAIPSSEVGSMILPDADGLSRGEVAEKNTPGMPETEPDVLVDAGAEFQEALAEEEATPMPEITTHRVPEAVSPLDVAEGATTPSMEPNTPVRPDSLSQPALAEADAIPSSEVGSMILPDADGLSRGEVAEKNTPGMPETEPDVLVDAGAEFQEALAEEEATPMPEITTHRVPEAVSPLDVAEGATMPSMEPNTPVRPDSLSQPALAETDAIPSSEVGSVILPDAEGPPEVEVAEENVTDLPQTEADLLVDSGARQKDALEGGDGRQLKDTDSQVQVDDQEAVLQAHEREVAAVKEAEEAAKKEREEALARQREDTARRAEEEAMRKEREVAALKALHAKQTKRGAVITLREKMFQLKGRDLNSEAIQTLMQVASFLHEYPERTIAIEGYTDSVGPAGFNVTVSRRRAQSVQSILLDGGIDPSRISVEGYGEARPIASNKSKAGRQRNRRVELVIQSPKSKGKQPL